MPPKDISSQSPQSVGAVAVENVSELVCYYESSPVSVVAKLRRIDWRMSKNDDSIRWKRCGISIHIVDVVGNDEIDFSSRRLELRTQLGESSLGGDCGALAFFLETAR